MRSARAARDAMAAMEEALMFPARGSQQVMTWEATIMPKHTHKTCVHVAQLLHAVESIAPPYLRHRSDCHETYSRKSC